MSASQLPVLTLDIDEEKIRQLHDISEKFKAAFGIGPAGLPATIPGGGAPVPIPGDNHEPRKPGGKNESGFDKFLKNLNKDASGTLKTFSLINKTLKATTSTLKGMFTKTLSWGAKVAALSMAGPFGYSMMARSVSDTYKTSLGMNVSTGQMQAADNVYGTRFSGASTILQNLAAAQNDPQNPAYAGLLSLGINPQDGAAANMPKLLSRVSDLLKQYKGTGVSQSVINGMGLGGVIDSTTANQVIANSDRIPMLNQQFSEQSNRLDKDMGSGTQESYQKVFTNFSYNADQIGNSFLKALSRLNGPITELSDSLTASIQKFLNGRNGKALFDAIASGLEKLANWLGSDSFQQDLDSFSKSITAIGRAIASVAKWISGFFGDDVLTRKNVGNAQEKSAFEKAYPATPTTPAVPAPEGKRDGSLWGLVKATGRTCGGIGGVIGKNMFPDLSKRMDAGGWYNYQNGDIKSYVEKMNDTARLPKGLMSAIAEKESSWDPGAVNKSSGAAGLFQFMPGTAEAYGLKGNDVFNPDKATYAAAKYLQDNMKRYDGDIAKSLTQYNGGRIDKEGNLSLKKETVDYLIKILPKVEGGLDQHPYLMHQLKASHEYLERSPEGTRSTIKLDINQMPGSDISAQVKGIYVTPR